MPRRPPPRPWLHALPGLLGALLLAACGAEWQPAAPRSAGTTSWPLPAEAAAPAVGGQNWDARLAAMFHFTPQGSRLIPRAWLLGLERADAPGAFAAPENLLRYGLVYAEDAGTGLNPDNLPVGFAVDDTGGDASGAWVGLTCAACHTGQVTIRGTRLRVDGAPANFDFDRFAAELDAAVQATARDPARLDRLARTAGTSATALREPFLQYAGWSARHAAVQHPTAVSGFARVDALTQILNALSVLHLDAPDAVRDANRRAPSAPVSYPFLWTTPRQDWVQWVPIASSPIGRNTGEVLGVFGHARLSGADDPSRFTSSVSVRGLVAMEDWLRRLRPPPWPEAALGPIDRATWEEGRTLVRANCTGCHNLPPFRMTDPRQSQDGSQFIRISAVPISVVQTDPTYLRSIGDWRIQTGPLLDVMGAAEVPAAEFFIGSVKQVVERGTRDTGLTRRMLLDTGEARACPAASPRLARQIPAPTGRFEAENVCALPDGRWRTAPERWAMPPRFLESMKAGPLLGLWATGPFLHNGSVPSVYDLLSPPEERPRVFWVGGREIDATKLGFVSTEAPGLFRFDTTMPGNSNQGHAFPRGAPLTPAQRLAVVEYLKDPLRFDDAARAGLE